MYSGAPAPARQLRRIAVVSANVPALTAIQQALAAQFDCRTLPSCAGLAPLLAASPLDAVVVDLDTQPISPNQALDAVREIRRSNQELVVVAVTRFQDPILRSRAAEAGVDEFLAAPANARDLQAVIERTLNQRGLRAEARRVDSRLTGPYSCCDIIGGSEVMRHVYDAILRVADSNISVVIRGESGTGKELVARAIVALGMRRNRPFISLNCAALPPALIEAELFGHEKGAFTGAHIARAGQIELAHGGTLFLDEIATLTLELQSKLLRVLEDRAVQRLGGKTSKLIDFRLLTATHENLEQMLHEGRFREDLYYRIHVVPIFLPPLRERRDDIPLLADHFLRTHCSANNLPLKRLDPEVVEIFEEYPWRGNIRELENLIQRLALMVEGPVIKPADLPQQVLYASATRQESLLIPENGINFEEEMSRIEVAYLQAALRRTGGRKVAAAALLHINPQRLKYLCRKYKLDLESV
jgi:two-component system response regulator PilR (NtrC family)